VQLGIAWKLLKNALIPVAAAWPAKTAIIAARIAKARLRLRILSVVAATPSVRTPQLVSVSDHFRQSVKISHRKICVAVEPVPDLHAQRSLFREAWPHGVA